MESYWETNSNAAHPVKYESEAAISAFPYCTESGLNFSTSNATYSEDDAEYTTGRRGKTSRQDPLSHRIIEKRRRDRMNSCLADLSRLIPPQYQRKGRGRIEKTEIIEMAIRHLKHLQNECLHKDIEYKMGYSDCMKETAKFLYESHMQDFCYRLIAHLQEHCDEIMKSECFKNRCNIDNISASSGSPPAHNYHPAATLSHLREMLTASDIEHSNSNDHNDVKDLSFRSQPHQAPVITSTAPHIATHHHESPSSNHDYDTSSRDRESLHLENSSESSPTPLHHNLDSTINNSSSNNTNASTNCNNNNVNNNNNSNNNSKNTIIDNTGDSHNKNNKFTSNHHLSTTTGDNPLQTVRVRNFSESSHEIEHNNNNNNYKYKNHIKQRFNQDHHIQDETTNDSTIGGSNGNSNISEKDHQAVHFPASHHHALHQYGIITGAQLSAVASAPTTTITSPNGLLSGTTNESLPDSKTDTEGITSVIAAPVTTLTKSSSNGILINGASVDVISLTRNKKRKILDSANYSSPEGLITENGNYDEKSPTLNSGRGTSQAENDPQRQQIKSESPSIVNSSKILNGGNSRNHHFAVPIFALHGQGTYYVPLNIDYEALLPYLQGIDLLEKSFCSMPILHPININVNFAPPTTANAGAGFRNRQNTFPRAKFETVANGW